MLPVLAALAVPTIIKTALAAGGAIAAATVVSRIANDAYDAATKKNEEDKDN